MSRDKSDKDEILWQLLDSEGQEEFRESLGRSGCWQSSWRNERERAMRHYIVSGQLCDPRRYELFFQACQRIGKDDVRAIGIDQAIKEERYRRRGLPPCPDCGGYNVKDSGRPLVCRECAREFGESRV